MYYSLNNQFNTDYISFQAFGLNGNGPSKGNDGVVNFQNVTRTLQINEIGAKSAAANPSATANAVADMPPPSNLAFFPSYSSREFRCTVGTKILFKLTKSRKVDPVAAN